MRKISQSHTSVYGSQQDGAQKVTGRKEQGAKEDPILAILPPAR